MGTRGTNSRSAFSPPLFTVPTSFGEMLRSPPSQTSSTTLAPGPTEILRCGDGLVKKIGKDQERKS